MVVALFPLALPKAAIWPVFVLAIIAAVISGILIVMNEQHLRRAATNHAVLMDDATLTHLKKLRGEFLKLHECREKLVEEAMKADWKTYLKYFSSPSVKDRLQKYKEDEHWTVIQDELKNRLTNPFLDELKKQSPTWEPLREKSLSLSTEIGDSELNKGIDTYLKRSDEWDAGRIWSEFMAKYSPSSVPEARFWSPRANRWVRKEVVDNLYKRVQERITELLQSQSSRIGSNE